MTSADIGDALRELYAVPPEHFTEQRDALAKRLKNDGHPEAAKEVKGRQRPTIAAWAVNELARRNKEKVAALIEAVETISEKGSAAENRSARKKRRDLIASLVDSARRILTDAGHSASAQTMGQVTRTLASATSSQELACLKDGTFSRSLEASGFEGSLGLDQEEETSSEQEDARAQEELSREIDELTVRLKERKKERQQAETKVDRARHDLEAAKGDLEAREKELENVEARLKASKEKKAASSG